MTVSRWIDALVGGALVVCMAISLVQIVASFAIYSYSRLYRQWKRRHDDPDASDDVVVIK